MGGAASKAVRKYPEAVSKARETVAKSAGTSSALNTARLAESHRTEAIEKDAADPDFLANLSKLGQVRVDHHMKAVRPVRFAWFAVVVLTRLQEATQTKRFFESRADSDLTMGQNRLYGFSLSDLLSKRKSVKTQAELQKLAEEYKIDVNKLEKLARFMTVPSVDGTTIRPAAKDGKSQDDGWAVWIEPVFKT
ncbi:hypothetical protein CPB83DRAFT_469833 [Crepidotus variabilis]|uniref:Uncharacterized protein n=1 Tax=Crepidotus variabilis TaxID=179855 RepID=A0A9P6ER34_9AGAR|nr:hypothetical protein CPB83DRAFT_469833 [Crepidotus variabilis]